MIQTVSAIVPVYNGASFIVDALKSITAQNYPVSEIIVIDDGSTDETAKVIEHSLIDVKYVYQPNQGAQYARNHGLRLAQGNVITFLDADDVWEENKLSQQIALLENADIVIGLTRILSDSSSIPFILPSLCCGLFRRSAFDKIGVFDTDLFYSDDLDWYMRAREAELRFVLHKDVVLYHRRHDSNLTRDIAKVKYYQLLMLKKSITRRSKLGIKTVPKFSSFFEDLLEVN